VQTCGLTAPAVARLPALAGQALLAWLLWRWLRRLHTGGAWAALAVVTFVLAPLQANLATVLAANTPWRACLHLLAVAWFGAHVVHRAPRRAAAAVLATAVALLLHEGAIALVVVLPAWWLLVHGRTGLARAARDPATWALLAVGAWRALDVVWLRPVQQHGIASFGAVQANLCRALLNWLPQDLRLPWLDALRGHHGGTTTAVALVALAGLVAVAAVFWRRSDAAGRFCLLLAALDPLPAVLVTGVGTARLHTGLPFLLAALALRTRAPGPHRGLACVLGALAIAYVHDSGQRLAAQRQADRIVRTLVADTAAAAHTAAGAPVVVADLPEFHGREDAVPMLAWGAESTLRHGGVTGPVWLVRTRAYRSSTSLPLLPADAFERLCRDHPGPVLQFDAALHRIVRRH
jgi:hypothetical protein